METRTYTISEDVRSQRSYAATVKSQKGYFLKKVDFLLPKFRLHLDEEARVRELMQYISQTFTYEDICTRVFADEHEKFIAQVESETCEKYRTEIDSLKNQISELQERICDAASAKSETSEKSKSKKYDRSDKYAKSLSEVLLVRAKKKKRKTEKDNKNDIWN